MIKIPGYPNKRDCEHGRQRGKCPECDLADADSEVRELREALRGLVAALDVNLETWPQQGLAEINTREEPLLGRDAMNALTRARRALAPDPEGGTDG